MLVNPFLKDNWEYYVNNRHYSYDTFREQIKLITGKLLEGNCIYLTVEERTKNKVERISFPVNFYDCDDRGHLFYNSDGEEVFRYHFSRRLGVYYLNPQLEEYQLINQREMDYPEDWLQGIVSYAYEDYYHKAQNWFGTDSDLMSFCDRLYMSDSSRLKLKELVLLRKMSNFKEEYGYENQILRRQLDDLYVL